MGTLRPSPRYVSSLLDLNIALPTVVYPPISLACSCLLKSLINQGGDETLFQISCRFKTAWFQPSFTRAPQIYRWHHQKAKNDQGQDRGLHSASASYWDCFSSPICYVKILYLRSMTFPVSRYKLQGNQTLADSQGHEVTTNQKGKYLENNIWNILRLAGLLALFSLKMKRRKIKEENISR